MSDDIFIKKDPVIEMLRRKQIDDKIKRMAEDKAKQLTTPLMKDSFADKPETQIVKGKIPLNSGNEIQKITPAKDFWKKIREKTKAGKAAAGEVIEGVAKKTKGLPVLGALATGLALESGDAAAAIPGLDSAESVGMSAEDEKMMLAERKALDNYIKATENNPNVQAMSSEEKKKRYQKLFNILK